VDYKDSGVSYFVNPTTNARVADFNQWDERYTPDTRTTQIKMASSARVRIQALEVWLPAGMVLIGVLVPGLLMIGKKKTRKPGKGAR
jgi:hypothetical protein